MAVRARHRDPAQPLSASVLRDPRVKLLGVPHRFRGTSASEFGPEISCPICLDPVDTRAWRELACGHCFHEGCVLRWVQSAPHPHCPLCRFDLEASALSEFEADFESFEAELAAFREEPHDRLCDLLVVLIGAEHCRRRLFDAALAHFLKLLGQTHGYEDQHVLGHLRELFNELLHQLHAVREVLEQRRSDDEVVERFAVESDADLIGALGGQLHDIHALLKRLSRFQDPFEDGDLEAARAVILPPDEACTLLQKYLAQVRHTCVLYTQPRGNAAAAEGDGSPSCSACCGEQRLISIGAAGGA